MAANDKAGAAYYLLLTEILFHFTLSVITIMMISVSFYKFFLAPDPGFFKFLFIYFMSFGLFCFFKMNHPLQNSFLPRVDALKPYIDLSKVYEKLTPMADPTLKASSPEGADAPEAIFITLPGDYMSSFPIWLLFYLTIFIIEINVWLNFDPAGAHKNFILFAIVQTAAGFAATLFMLPYVSPHPRSTHFGFPILFAVLFTARLAFFASFLHNSWLWSATGGLALFYIAAIVFYIKKNPAYHVFIRTNSGDIWHATSTAAMKSLDGLEKMGFYVRCRYVETPYSNVIIIKDGEVNPPEKYKFPYYLGVDRSQFEKSIDVFGGRVNTGSRLKPEDYLEVFEKISQRDFNREYSSRHMGIFLIFLIMSFVISYETYKLVFFTETYFNKYTYLIKLTFGYVKEIVRVIFSI